MTEFDKMQNASAGANKQIRILVIQVIDPRVLHDEHESNFCGQKSFRQSTTTFRDISKDLEREQ